VSREIEKIKVFLPPFSPLNKFAPLPLALHSWRESGKKNRSASERKRKVSFIKYKVYVWHVPAHTQKERRKTKKVWRW
jgi:hypothetical protein